MYNYCIIIQSYFNWFYCFSGLVWRFIRLLLVFFGFWSVCLYLLRLLLCCFGAVAVCVALCVLLVCGSCNFSMLHFLRLWRLLAASVCLAWRFVCGSGAFSAAGLHLWPLLACFGGLCCVLAGLAVHLVGFGVFSGVLWRLEVFKIPP